MEEINEKAIYNKTSKPSRSKPVIKRAVAKWLEKPRRKLGAPTPERLRCPVTVGVQTDTCMALDTVTPCREEIRAVLKEILVEGEGDYYSSSSSDEDSDMFGLTTVSTHS
ncbi:hypothetical protein MAR_021754 [Mya arenaria]|uniref:Uncharacterized protein n=1 Tax=Mya arenaria TaxID=6604 RepID=A0ABY7EBK7_MYAAR|nr:hypothetical protein MAR_021754 [Mya arenaria]